jgi:hypothetical protein
MERSERPARALVDRSADCSTTLFIGGGAVVDLDEPAKELAPARAGEGGLRTMGVGVDEDLDGMSRDDLIAEARRLREGIRIHRDSSGHELCWHHPEL